MPITNDPATVVYLVTAATLAVHMVLLDAYGGVVRVRSRTVINPEDLSVTSAGTTIVEEDPAAVARVMRAHRNLIANGVPFLLLGFAWVLTGASLPWALGIFGTFVAARFAHTIAYVSEKQPWRTASFVVGQLALAGVVVGIVRNVIVAAAGGQ